MSANGAQNPIKELEWLAHYYHRHGFADKAKEILERVEVSRHRTSTVVDMFECDDDDERRA